jgi:hypothetical protein
LEGFAVDKRPSLFLPFISDNEKSFKTLPPGINVIKLSFFIADKEAK